MPSRRSTGLPREVGPIEERVSRHLDRLATDPAAANVFSNVLADESRHAARVLDRTAGATAKSRPLHGALVGVKANVALAGTTLDLGSRAIARPCSADAPVATSLRDGGSVILGHTTMHELAFGVTGIGVLGTPANPRAAGRIPGGSSSGSAVAVATGLCDVAIGTDTGGSVRIPAALCGVVGYKPSLGALPTDGVAPLAPTLDHVGLFAPTVSGVVAAARVLMGQLDSRAPVRTPSGAVDTTVRFGVIAGSDLDLAPEVRRSFELAVAAIERIGSVRSVTISSSEEVVSVSNCILYFEAYDVFSGDLAAAGDRFGADVASRLEAGSRIGATEYRAALSRRAELLSTADKVFGTVDILVSPTVPIVAPTLEDAPRLGLQLVRNTRIHNLLGLPAATLPMNRTGVPTGVQLAASRGRDGFLLRVAQALEAPLHS